MLHLLQKTATALMILGLLTGCGKASPNTSSNPSETEAVSTPEEDANTASTPLSSPVSSSLSVTPADPTAALFESPLCSWIKDTQLRIHLIVPDALRDQTSYTAGFQYNRAPSGISYNEARLARQGCDYWVGFYANETEGVTGAHVIAYGGEHNNLTLRFLDEPILLDFANGLPSEGLTVEAEVTGATNSDVP
jgi:hypothetical protein